MYSSCSLDEGTHSWVRLVAHFALGDVSIGNFCCCWQIEYSHCPHVVLLVDVLYCGYDHELLNAAAITLLEGIGLVLEILVDLALV